jgi:excisionase family DNA binding protein
MISSDHTAGLDEGGRITTLPAPARGKKVELAVAPRLFRLKDAASYLSMGTKAIRKLTRSGKLPYVQVDKNAPFLIDRNDLDRFIAEHKINGY